MAKMRAQSSQVMGLTGYAYILASTTSFAFMAAVSKAVGAGVTSEEKIWWRSVISVAVTGCPRRRPARPWLLAARGICGHLALVAYLESLNVLPLQDAVLIAKLHPLFAAALARLFLGEPLGWRRVAAMAASLLGVALLGAARSEAQARGALLALLSAAGAGAAYTCVRALRGEEERWVLLAFPAVSAPLTLLSAHWPPARPLQMLLLGLFTQGGQLALVRGLRQLPTAAATQAMHFGSVVAVLLGAALGDPLPTLRTAGAAAIIISALYAADAKGKQS